MGAAGCVDIYILHMYGVLWADEKYEDLQRCSFDYYYCLSNQSSGVCLAVVSGLCFLGE